MMIDDVVVFSFGTILAVLSIDQSFVESLYIRNAKCDFKVLSPVSLRRCNHKL